MFAEEVGTDEAAADLDDRLARDAESIRKWIHAIAAVKFDLELGPVLECVYPEKALSDTVEYAITTMAMPDSAKGDLDGCVFTVRMTSEDLFGVVCFRQIPDPTIPRGFFQKSLVILTRLPLSALFEQVIKILAPIYFEHGHVAVLEAAARNWSEWPDPISASGNLQLAFLGQVIEFNISNAMIRRGDLLYGSYIHVNLYETFRKVLPYLWNLWEIIITGGPLLIIADDPTISTNMVLGLISLASPIFLYHADYRPYFTLTDPDYRFYLDMCVHNKLPACILGTASEYLAEALNHFPNVLRVTSSSRISLSMDSDYNMRFDSVFLTSLEQSPSKDTLLREYFQLLTKSFLAPFETLFKPIPHVRRKTPSARIFNPYLDQPKLPEFLPERLVADLTASKDNLPHEFRRHITPKKIAGLFRMVMYGPNFLPWFAYRTSLAMMDIDARTDAAIIAADPNEITNELVVAEAEAMLKEIKRRKTCPRSQSRPTLLDALHTHYQVILEKLARIGPKSDYKVFDIFH